MSLFESEDELQPATPDLPATTRHERLRKEYESLGFLCGLHPLELLQKQLDGSDFVKAKDIAQFSGQWIRFVGMIITGKVVQTQHGEPMEFITFEDETGLIETVFFSEAYRRFIKLLKYSGPLIVVGRVVEEFDAYTVEVKTLTPFKTTKI